MVAATSRIGEQGTIEIPEPLRRMFGLAAGSLVTAEASGDGILIRPAPVFGLETYSPERRAEFFLNNAVTPADYAVAVEEIRKLGLDPSEIPHVKPTGA